MKASIISSMWDHLNHGRNASRMGNQLSLQGNFWVHDMIRNIWYILFNSYMTGDNVWATNMNVIHTILPLQFDAHSFGDRSSSS